MGTQRIESLDNRLPGWDTLPMSRTFKIILEKESSGFSVIVPSLPGCCTQGETIQECMVNAKEAIELYLESLKEDNLPIPDADVLLEEVEVTV